MYKQQQKPHPPPPQMHTQNNKHLNSVDHKYWFQPQEGVVVLL